MSEKKIYFCDTVTDLLGVEVKCLKIMGLC